MHISSLWIYVYFPIGLCRPVPFVSYLNRIFIHAMSELIKPFNNRAFQTCLCQDDTCCSHIHTEERWQEKIVLNSFHACYPCKCHPPHSYHLPHPHSKQDLFLLSESRFFEVGWKQKKPDRVIAMNNRHVNETSQCYMSHVSQNGEAFPHALWHMASLSFNVILQSHLPLSFNFLPFIAQLYE